MEKSYEEILRVLQRMNKPAERFVYRGSDRWMPDAQTPVKSDAAADLIDRAMAGDGEHPLYVATIGAPTNVASALVMEPKLAERIVVVWLGGQPLWCPVANEFNLKQNPAASQTLFDSGVPMVLIPCKTVAELLTVSLPEMNEWVRPCGAIGEYLYEIFEDYIDDHFAHAKVIWDISTIAWLIDARWADSNMIHAPVLNDNLRWSRDDNRHFIRLVTHLNRNAIYRDLFTRIRNFSAKTST